MKTVPEVRVNSGKTSRKQAVIKPSFLGFFANSNVLFHAKQDKQEENIKSLNLSPSIWGVYFGSFALAFS